GELFHGAVVAVVEEDAAGGIFRAEVDVVEIRGARAAAIVDALAEEGVEAIEGEIFLLVVGGIDAGDVVEEELVALRGEVEPLLQKSAVAAIHQAFDQHASSTVAATRASEYRCPCHPCSTHIFKFRAGHFVQYSVRHSSARAILSQRWTSAQRDCRAGGAGF